ncbi:hypothetical protein H4582DRAFT_2061274 [Lactarius indigo]|nr:hypothetical protein H4582DRAFT_2061274 [Lactarius indigo]
MEQHDRLRADTETIEEQIAQLQTDHAEELESLQGKLQQVALTPELEGRLNIVSKQRDADSILIADLQIDKAMEELQQTTRKQDDLETLLNPSEPGVKGEYLTGRQKVSRQTQTWLLPPSLLLANAYADLMRRSCQIDQGSVSLGQHASADDSPTVALQHRRRSSIHMGNCLGAGRHLELTWAAAGGGCCRNDRTRVHLAKSEAQVSQSASLQIQRGIRESVLLAQQAQRIINKSPSYPQAFITVHPPPPPPLFTPPLAKERLDVALCIVLVLTSLCQPTAVLFLSMGNFSPTVQVTPPSTFVIVGGDGDLNDNVFDTVNRMAQGMARLPDMTFIVIQDLGNVTINWSGQKRITMEVWCCDICRGTDGGWTLGMRGSLMNRREWNPGALDPTESFVQCVGDSMNLKSSDGHPACPQVTILGLRDTTPSLISGYLWGIWLCRAITHSFHAVLPLHGDVFGPPYVDIETAFFLPGVSPPHVYDTLIHVGGYKLLITGYFDNRCIRNPNLQHDFPLIPWQGEIAVLFIGKRRAYVSRAPPRPLVHFAIACNCPDHSYYVRTSL